MTNKEKFLKLVTEDSCRTAENIKWRIQNRKLLRKLNRIKLKQYEQDSNQKSNK